MHGHTTPTHSYTYTYTQSHTLILAHSLSHNTHIPSVSHTQSPLPHFLPRLSFLDFSEGPELTFTDNLWGTAKGSGSFNTSHDSFPG